MGETKPKYSIGDIVTLANTTFISKVTDSNGNIKEYDLSASFRYKILERCREIQTSEDYYDGFIYDCRLLADGVEVVESFREEMLEREIV